MRLNGIDAWLQRQTGEPESEPDDGWCPGCFKPLTEDCECDPPGDVQFSNEEAA